MYKCPVCLVGLRTPLVMNPISRKDNKTYICSTCALEEGLARFTTTNKEKRDEK